MTFNIRKKTEELVKHEESNSQYQTAKLNDE